MFRSLQSLRGSLRCTSQLVAPRPPLLMKSMVAVMREASTLPDIPETLQSSPLFEKLRQSPTIIQEIIKITTLFEAKGIAMNAKPSFTDMMKLARDTEIQDAMKNLKRVMDEEGVTVDIQELLKNMPK